MYEYFVGNMGKVPSHAEAVSNRDLTSLRVNENGFRFPSPAPKVGVLPKSQE